jgi:hypothetical protein
MAGRHTTPKLWRRTAHVLNEQMLADDPTGEAKSTLPDDATDPAVLDHLRCLCVRPRCRETRTPGQ